MTTANKCIGKNIDMMVMPWSILECYPHTELRQGLQNFPKISEPPLNLKRHKGVIKFIPKAPQLSDAKVQNLVAWVTWYLGFVHSSPKVTEHQSGYQICEPLIAAGLPEHAANDTWQILSVYTHYLSFNKHLHVSACIRPLSATGWINDDVMTASHPTTIFGR